MRMTKMLRRKKRRRKKDGSNSWILVLEWVKIPRKHLFLLSKTSYILLFLFKQEIREYVLFYAAGFSVFSFQI